jgi:hypothetical protein
MRSRHYFLETPLSSRGKRELLQKKARNFRKIYKNSFWKAFQWKKCNLDLMQWYLFSWCIFFILFLSQYVLILIKSNRKYISLPWKIETSKLKNLTWLVTWETSVKISFTHVHSYMVTFTLKKSFDDWFPKQWIWVLGEKNQVVCNSSKFNQVRRFDISNHMNTQIFDIDYLAFLYLDQATTNRSTAETILGRN